MTSVFDKLNLTPAERRLVIMVGIVVFVVLNFWLVFPMFGEYGKYDQRIHDANATLKKYQDEINKRSNYEKELKQLENQAVYIPTEEAALRLSQEVNSQAALSGVTVTSITQMQRQGSGGKTNAFFEEAAVTVNINTGEKELVDFLYRLADKDLLIRAKSMTLGTDPSQTRLQGQITLVKSFQRRPPKTTVAAAVAKPAARPAATPATSPAKPATPPPTAIPARPPQAVPQPAPTPSGGTNRPRRSVPSPARP
jgi:Tfp pilus assembly protein PilO